MSIAFDEYAAIRAMNASTLVKGFKSMLALKRAVDGARAEETAAMRLGQNYHRLILEPEEFRRCCVVQPDFANNPDNVDKNGKRSSSPRTSWAIAQAESFASTNAGKSIVSQKDYDKSLAMLKSLSTHPKISDWLVRAETEVTLQGVVGDTPCKARVDLLIRDECLFDLKGTSDCRPHIFCALACRLHYPERMGFYQELVRQELGIKLPVKLIVAETQGDFDRCVYTMDQEVLDHGFGRMSRLILQYEEAQKTNRWPGVDEGKQEIPFAAPNWWMPPDGEDGMLDWADIGSESESPQEAYF